MTGADGAAPAGYGPTAETEILAAVMHENLGEAAEKIAGCLPSELADLYVWLSETLGLVTAEMRKRPEFRGRVI